MNDAMSASGTKRTLACALHMSAFRSKADIEKSSAVHGEQYGVGSKLGRAVPSETLPPAAEVTSMAPSVTPSRTGVRIDRRCRIHARRHIDGIFINHHWRPRYNDGSRLLDNDRRRSPVRVRVNVPLVAWNVAIRSYLQIGGHGRRGKS